MGKFVASFVFTNLIGLIFCSPLFVKKEVNISENVKVKNLNTTAANEDIEKIVLDFSEASGNGYIINLRIGQKDNISGGDEIIDFASSGSGEYEITSGHGQFQKFDGSAELHFSTAFSDRASGSGSLIQIEIEKDYVNPIPTEYMDRIDTVSDLESEPTTPAILEATLSINRSNSVVDPVVKTAGNSFASNFVSFFRNLFG